MRIATSLLAVAGIASAFLIPPQINKDDLKEIATTTDLLSLKGEIYTQGSDVMKMRTLVQLSCDGCYGDGKEDGALILDVEIPEPKRDALVINGASMIPLGPNIGLNVPMIKADHSILDYILLGTADGVVEVGLGYDLVVAETMLGDHSAINFKLSVFKVDGRIIPAGNIDTLDMTLHKDEKTGELNILKLDVNREKPGKLSEEKFTCAGLFCHLKQGMDQKFEAFMGKAASKFDRVKSKFGGKKGCHHGKFGRPATTTSTSATFPQGFDIGNHPHRRPHHGRPHVMHNFDQYDNGESERSTFVRIFKQVIVPIILGVIAGIALYRIGVFLGMALAIISMTTMRCIKAVVPRCPHAARRAREREQAQGAEDESRKGLLAAEEKVGEQEDAPPSYEDVDEGVSVVVVDSVDEKQ